MIHRAPRHRRRPTLEHLEDRRLLARLEPINSAGAGASFTSGGSSYMATDQIALGSQRFVDVLHHDRPWWYVGASTSFRHNYQPIDSHTESYLQYTQHMSFGSDPGQPLNANLIGGTGDTSPFGSTIAFQIVPDDMYGEEIGDRVAGKIDFQIALAGTAGTDALGNASGGGSISAWLGDKHLVEANLFRDENSPRVQFNDVAERKGISFEARIGDTVQLSLNAQMSGTAQPQSLSYGQSVVSLWVDLVFSVGFEAIPELLPFSLTAQHDDEIEAYESDPDVFGLYLEGVPLSNTFTASLADWPQADRDRVAKVELTIPGMGKLTAPRVGSTAKFTVNMGDARLKAGDHAISARALDADGEEVGVYEGGTLVIKEPNANLKLKATYPGGPESPVDLENLRLIAGIPMGLSLTGTITGVPDYYRNMIQEIHSSARGAKVLTTVSTSSIGFREFALAGVSTVDAGLFAAGQHNLFAPFTVGAGILAGATNTRSLLVVDLPSWMVPEEGSPNKSYNSAVSGVFPTTGGAYVIGFTLPSSPFIKREMTSGTPFGLFDGLETVFQAGVTLVAYARPTMGPGDALLRLQDAFIEAKFLGHNLLPEQRYRPDNLKIEGGLAPRSLELDGSLSIAMINDVVIDDGGTLIDRKFGASTSYLIGIPVPEELAKEIGTDATVRFDGRFQLTLEPTKIWLGMALKPAAGGGLEFDPAGTALKITVGAGAALTAESGLKAEVLGYTVAEANVIGAAYAHVWGRFVVSASGPLSKPTIAFDAGRSEAGLAVGFGAHIRLEAFGAGTGFKPTYFPDVVPLFRLSPSYMQKVILKVTVRERVRGLIDPEAKGFEGVSPTKGGEMAILGDVSPGVLPNPAPFQPQMMRAAALASTTTQSVLPLDAPIFMGADRVEFDLNALADRGSLTPGSHALDVVLFGDDGSEVHLGRIDLAGEALSPNANPLGFAGGWRRVSLSVPAGALAFGVVYRPEFRLETDAETGERAAVAIEDVQVIRAAPALTTAGDDWADGVLNIDGEGVLVLSNPSAVPLKINDPTIVGDGFELVDPIGSFAILAGGRREIRIRAINPASAASAILRFATNDPSRPEITFALRSAGKAEPPPVDPKPGDPKPQPPVDPNPSDPTPQPPVDPKPGDPAPEPPIIPGPADPTPPPPVPEPTGPRVIAVDPLINRGRLAGFALTFDRALARRPLIRPRGVQIASPGRDQVFGTFDDRRIGVTGARLDPTGTRLVVAIRPLPALGGRHQVRLLAGAGIRGADGRPGGEFAQVVEVPNRPARLAPPRRPWMGVRGWAMR